MKLLSFAVAAAFLPCLTLPRPTKDGLCFRNTCEYQYIFAVSPKVWSEYFTTKLVMLPGQTDTVCAPSEV
ncbi:hypothetical protein BG003_000424 [Podila horticola]|nr:hypothetical protein BG003_000424 [Podila horticola]